jgi:hypothetical protein
MENQRLTLPEYHARPNFGKSGKQIQVNANMFQARFKKQGMAIQRVSSSGKSILMQHSRVEVKS